MAIGEVIRLSDYRQKQALPELPSWDELIAYIEAIEISDYQVDRELQQRQLRELEAYEQAVALYEHRRGGIFRRLFA